MTGLDTQDFEQCKSFFEEHTLLKLDCVKTENEWQRLAVDFLLDCQSQQEVEDKCNCLTIGMNTTRGRTLFP